MLTSKQRAALRSIASGEEVIFQMGKDGVTDGFVDGVDKALAARELIKIKVLNTAPISVREAGERTADAVGAEFVAAIGNRFILYRFSNSKNVKHIEFGDKRK